MSESFGVGTVRGKVDHMKDLSAHPVELGSDQLKFLQEMAAAYDLPDVGKAIRCLINHARENPERRDEIFAEVRCLDC